MKRTSYSLVLDWAELMALSIGMAFAANIMTPSRPGAVWLVVVACIAAAKARIILHSYLGLFRAPAALDGFFSVALTVLALVLTSFLIFPTPARVSGGPNVIAATFAGGNE
jgi:hypothetical protein